MEENNYVVYRHTSPNSKVYIGITSKKPEYRWNNGNGYKDSPKFYRSIQKYGWTNFKHEILYSGLNEISAKMIEEDLIYYYKKLNISLNITDGGEGAKGRVPWNKGLKGLQVAWNKGKKFSEETRKKISDANLGKHLSEYHKKKLIESRCKQVLQYFPNGTLFATYKSISEASLNTRINKSNISKCCKGKQKTAGGFIWKFK